MEIKSVNLKDYSSLRIGGEAKLVYITSLSMLTEALMYAREKKVRIHVLGEGTNTFFGSSLDEVLMIKIAIKGISFEEQEGSVVVTAQAGEIWDDLVRFAVDKNLWGLENLSYIPGTVGAAPVQNIGAYGSSLSDVFVSLSAIDLVTLNLVEISKEACCFGYRDSLFKQEPGRYAIISVSVKLSKHSMPVLSYKPLDTLQSKESVTLQEIRDLVIATRKAKLPNYHEYPNAGSFFKNPVINSSQAESLIKIYPDIKLIEQDGDYKIPAAWLIEHVAEMKGVRHDSVGTYQNQPLVIVNYDNATGEELISFSEQIIQKVKDKTGITLEREVNFVR